MRVEVKPELLRWARERAGLELEDLVRRFPRLAAWETGEAQPTLRQIEVFARTVHTPVGYLFLAAPPEEQVPIPDFRTVGNRHIARPSPELLDTLYLCEQRQDWFRDFARSIGDEPLAFVGSATLASDVVAIANVIRTAVGFDLEERRRAPTWTDALRLFIDKTNELGVLVMVNGVAGNNNRRKLDPDEFRGFALVDPLAPVVFVNGADTKAAQMFTLAHEVAHIWLGQSALSDTQPVSMPSHRVEIWCNRVAVELLVPLAEIGEEYRRDSVIHEEMARLARRFKVSTLVILRRIHDAGHITRGELQEAYDAELERLRALPKGGGGDFYLTLGARAGKRFARAVVTSALEGRSSFTEAFRLLGFKKMATFQELGRSLGLVA